MTLPTHALGSNELPVANADGQPVLAVMPLAERKGGAELALLHLLRHGQEQGVDWRVAFLQDGPMVRQVRELGVAAHVIEAGRLRQTVRYAATVRALAKLARRTEASAVLGWMGKAQLYGGAAAKLAGIPAVWFQHGIPSGGWIDRLATQMPAVAVLTCSHFVATAQRKLRPLRDVRVVHPGAELERFDPQQLPSPEATKRRLGLPADRPTIGIVGRLQSWKGMHVLLEAMPAVLRRHPGATALVVGGEHALEADYPRTLQAQIERLKLRESVVFAGHQTNVPEWMHAMDVVVHASHHEPFGIVVVEAMALGKPVIATVPGGPAEVIRDGVEGQLVPFGDAEALAAAVGRYLNDPEFASVCGRQARRRSQIFSAEAFARRTCEAIRELTGSPAVEETTARSGARQAASL